MPIEIDLRRFEDIRRPSAGKRKFTLLGFLKAIIVDNHLHMMTAWSLLLAVERDVLKDIGLGY